MRQTPIQIVLLAVLLLAGCSFNAGLADHPEVNQGALPDWIDIPLPLQPSVQRDLSAITEWTVWGNTTGPKGGTYSADGNSLILTATPNELSYAVYELYGGAYSFDTIHFDVADIVNPEALWFGVSDYDGNHWRWMQLDPGTDSISLGGFTAKGKGGAAYLAIAAWNGGIARVNKVWIELDKPEWIKEPVVLNAGMGQVNGMAIVAGWPCIAAVDQLATDSFNIHYFRATAQLPGNGDWNESLVIIGFTESPAAIELLGDEGFLPNVALVDDSGGLYYGYSTSSAPAGESDWSWCGISNARDNELGFAIVSGKPAILYNDFSLDGGDALVYVRANTEYPALWSDWDILVVSSTSSSNQEYTGLSLAAIDGLIPGIQYWDDLANEHRYATSEWPMPSDPGQLNTTAVHVPSLGGFWSATVSWFGSATLFYDSANSSAPRFAHGTFMPTTPDNFEYHHQILGRGCEEIVACATDDWVGAAWRDLETGGIMFAMYDYVPQLGPDSGEDWKVALVDGRNTAGEIGLVSLAGGVPGICYHATADGLLYFAYQAPPT